MQENEMRPDRRQLFEDIARMKNSLDMVRDPMQTIYQWSPHYTNDYYRKARTIYLAKTHQTALDQFGNEYVDGASYDYSDRIYSWYQEKEDLIDRAVEIANQQPKNSAAWAEAWMRVLYDKPTLKIVHILAGFNVSNGYAYRVYGYIVPEDARR